MSALTHLLLSALLAAGAPRVASPAPAASPASPSMAQRIGALQHASPAEVGAFLRAIDGATFEEGTIGDFRVLAPDRSEAPTLLVTIDPSGRGFFNELYILHPAGESVESQVVETWGLRSLAGALADLAGDGRMELIVPVALTPYRSGTDPVATWRAVFSPSRGQYVERSADFPTFYQAGELPRIARELAQAEAALPGAFDRRPVHRVEALEIERDKIQRVLGRDPNAGLGQARQWAKSSDPVERTLAIGVLADLEDAAAQLDLAGLTHDPDAQVAIYAAAFRTMRENRHRR
jgi:hypothetical protein